MATPWGAMLKRAAGLGVTPDAFWRLSVREWRMLTEPEGSAAPMGRAAFEAMSARWPDGG